MTKCTDLAGESARAFNGFEDSGIRTASTQAWRPESRGFFRHHSRHCSDESLLPEVTIDDGSSDAQTSTDRGAGHLSSDASVPAAAGNDRTASSDVPTLSGEVSATQAEVPAVPAESQSPANGSAELPSTGDSQLSSSPSETNDQHQSECDRQRDVEREQEFQRQLQELQELLSRILELIMSMLQAFAPPPPEESQQPAPEEPQQPAPPSEQPVPPSEQPAPPSEQPAPPSEQPAPPSEQPAPPSEQPAPPAEPRPQPPSDQSAPPTDRPAPPAEQPPQPTSDHAKLIHIFPETNADWDKIIADSPKGSLIVPLPSRDVSWDSDRPFNSLDPDLQRNIADASAAGLNPIGYVGTRGGTRPIDEVKAEIDSWYRASEVKGIYLGDSGDHNAGGGYATDPATEAYFKELGRYIKSKGGIAVINGGGTPNQDYMDTFDVQGTFEQDAHHFDNFAPPVADWQQNYSPDRFSAVVVGVGQNDIGHYEDLLRSHHNGYIAVSPDWGVASWKDAAYWNRALDGLDGRMDGQIPD